MPVDWPCTSRTVEDEDEEEAAPCRCPLLPACEEPVEEAPPACCGPAAPLLASD